MSRRLCHWPGCKRAPIYVRKVRLASGRIQKQIRADNQHGLCPMHNRRLQESERQKGMANAYIKELTSGKEKSEQ